MRHGKDKLCVDRSLLYNKYIGRPTYRAIASSNKYH